MWTFIMILAALLLLLGISKALSIRNSKTEAQGDALTIEASKLAQAQRALFQSEQRLEKLRASLRLTDGDIVELKSRILQENDSAQLLLTQELVQREEEKERLKKKIADAETDHTEAQCVVQQFAIKLREIRDDVEELKVKRDLAEAGADAANLAADLHMGLSVARDIGSQREEILALQAKAEIDRRVTPAGEPKISPAERLAALKQELEKTS